MPNPRLDRLRLKQPSSPDQCPPSPLPVARPANLSKLVASRSVTLRQGPQTKFNRWWEAHAGKSRWSTRSWRAIGLSWKCCENRLGKTRPTEKDCDGRSSARPLVEACRARKSFLARQSPSPSIQPDPLPHHRTLAPAKNACFLGHIDCFRMFRCSLFTDAALVAFRLSPGGW